MKVLIIYFSGTGNTLQVATHLKTALVNSEAIVHLHSIKDGGVSKKTIESYDLVGFAFPVFGFGTPQIMMDYEKNIPSVRGMKAFILQTGADFISLNHAASYRFIKKLKHKGYRVYYDRIIAMGSNWLVGYDWGLVKQLEEASQRKTVHMAKELLEGVNRRYRTNWVTRGSSLLMVLGEHYVGAKLFGLSLKVKKDCIHCNRCIESCPSNNISMVNNSVQIGSNCSWCMRCIYQCPQNAIYSNSMNFCAIKGGYNLKKILEENKPPYVDGQTKGYYKHFWAYLNDDQL